MLKTDNGLHQLRKAAITSSRSFLYYYLGPTTTTGDNLSGTIGDHKSCFSVKNAINIKDHVTSPVTKRKNTYSINDQPRRGFGIFIVSSSLTVSLLNKTSGFQSFAFLIFYWFCDPTDASAVLDFSILHKNSLVDHHWNFNLLLSFA